MSVDDLYEVIYMVYFAKSAASYIIKYTIIQNELRDQTHTQTYLILNRQKPTLTHPRTHKTQ